MAVERMGVNEKGSEGSLKRRRGWRGDDCFAASCQVLLTTARQPTLQQGGRSDVVVGQIVSEGRFVE